MDERFAVAPGNKKQASAASDDKRQSFVWASHVRHDPPRVVVADDDHEMRSLVVEALTNDGYEVVEVPDGGRLLVNLTRSFLDNGGSDWDMADLVVSDVRMPVCTGVQILEQLRAADWRVPVILMTGYADPVTCRQASKLGSTLFQKPFGIDELRAAVATVLQREAA
jgi:DNA-binding response OmpR family regulator